MAVNDSEKKTAAILEKRTEKGKELEQFNEAQGQLLSLQAEQRNILNEQRVVSSMEAQNNQTLAQAAGVLAASGGAATSVPSVNPNTSAILSKYGINKPGTTTSRNTVQTKSPQKISVVNNNTTTNNIQISQPQIPMATPVIPMKNNTENFKVWINNAFAKQNEAAAIREKEYQKREWSLTRSTNKMIRKMGEIGKNIGQSLNPKNLGNAFTDQFKTLMFLMGFQYVAKNIGSILEKVDSFFNGEGKWIEKLKNGLSNVLEGPISNLLTGLKDLFTYLFDRLKDELRLFFEDRGKAVKSIEFPKIDAAEDLKDVLGTLLGYLGNVVTAAFSGTEGLKKIKLDDFKSSGKNSSIESYEDEYSHTQDIGDHIDVSTYSGEGIRMSNVSLGDTVTSVRGFDKNFKMASTDYNSFGGLSNAVGASIKQGNYLVNLHENAIKEGSAVNISQYVSGLSALKSSARRYGGIFISKSSLKAICDSLGLPDNIINNIISNMETVLVIYCIVPKSEAEMVDENAGSFGSSFGKVYVEGEIVGSLSNGAENTRRRMNSAKKGNYAETLVTDATIIGTSTATGIAIGSVLGPGGSVAGGIIGALVGLVQSIWGDNTALAATVSGIASETRRSAHDKYTVKAFDVNDPRIKKYVPFLTRDGLPYVDKENNIYLRLTPKIIKLIEDLVKRQHNVDNFSFDGDNLETLNFLNKVLNTDVDGSLIPGGLLNLESDLDKISQLEYENKVARSELEAKYAGRGFDRFINTGEVNPNYNFDYVDTSDVYRNAKPIDNSNKEGDLLKQRVNYVMDRLCSDPELKLTPIQAAGLVGNLISESGLKPDAKYSGDIPNEGKWSRARGIAQWLGERQEKFYNKYNKYPDEAPLEDQVDFLIEELKTTHKGFLNKVQDVTNVADSASVGLYNFEFQIGDKQSFKKHIEKLREKGTDEDIIRHYEEILPTEEKRQENAAQALKTFEEYSKSSSNNNGLKSKVINGFQDLLGYEPRTLQEELMLQFSPTSLIKKQDAIVFDENGNISEFANPLSDSSSMSSDQFAVNYLTGAERSWYQNYGKLNPQELELKLGNEGIKKQRYYDGFWHKISDSLHTGLGGKNRNIIFELEADGDFDSFFGKEMSALDAEKEFNKIVSSQGLSGIITKYLKEGHYKNKDVEYDRALVVNMARALLNKDDVPNYTYEQAEKDLDKFVKEKLNNNLTPTLNSSIFYHTDEEQRKRLYKQFIPSNLVTDEDIETNNIWEKAYLGKSKINEINKDRYNMSVTGTRLRFLEKNKKRLEDERKISYLEEYITNNAKEGQFVKDKDEKYNLEVASGMLDDVQKYYKVHATEVDRPNGINEYYSPFLDKLGINLNPFSYNIPKMQELPENIKDLIREKLGKEAGSPLTNKELFDGFELLKKSVTSKDTSYEDSLKILKEFTSAQKMADLGLKLEELEDSNIIDTSNHMVNLIKAEMDKKDGKSYLMEELNLSGESVDNLINQVKESGTIKDWNTIRNTDYYKRVHSAVKKYRAGELDKLSNQLDEVKTDFGDLSGKASEDLKKLASMPRIKVGTDEYKLLTSVYGKDLSMDSIPNQNIDIIQQNATSNELLTEILRNTIINGEIERCIANIDREQLIVGMSTANNTSTTAQATVANLAKPSNQVESNSVTPWTPPF